MIVAEQTLLLFPETSNADFSNDFEELCQGLLDRTSGYGVESGKAVCRCLAALPCEKGGRSARRL